MRNDAVRQMVDLRDRTLQKARIAFGNRVDAIMREQDSADEATTELLSRWHSRFLELEEEADKDIRQLVSDMPIIEQVVKVKGIAEFSAAKLIAMIDIERAPTVSSLWRYCGWGVVNGERERPISGEKLHYNGRLKTICYVIGMRFLQSHSPYAQVYESAYEYYFHNRPEWGECITCQSTLPKCSNPELHSSSKFRSRKDKKQGWRTDHLHLASMRKMIKLFLSHLWIVWRQLEGLPITDPYVFSHLGHQHYYSPKDFGW